jgi:hypothetical protein
MQETTTRKRKNYKDFLKKYKSAAAGSVTNVEAASPKQQEDHEKIEEVARVLSTEVCDECLSILVYAGVWRDESIESTPNSVRSIFLPHQENSEILAVGLSNGAIAHVDAGAGRGIKPQLVTSLLVDKVVSNHTQYYSQLLPTSSANSLFLGITNEIGREGVNAPVVASSVFYSPRNDAHDADLSEGEEDDEDSVWLDSGRHTSLQARFRICTSSRVSGMMGDDGDEQSKEGWSHVYVSEFACLALLTLSQEHRDGICCTEDSRTEEELENGWVGLLKASESVVKLIRFNKSGRCDVKVELDLSKPINTLSQFHSHKHVCIYSACVTDYIHLLVAPSSLEGGVVILSLSLQVLRVVNLPTLDFSFDRLPSGLPETKLFSLESSMMWVVSGKAGLVVVQWPKPETQIQFPISARYQSLSLPCLQVNDFPSSQNRLEVVDANNVQVHNVVRVAKEVLDKIRSCEEAPLSIYLTLIKELRGLASTEMQDNSTPLTGENVDEDSARLRYCQIIWICSQHPRLRQILPLLHELTRQCGDLLLVGAVEWVTCVAACYSAKQTSNIEASDWESKSRDAILEVRKSLIRSLGVFTHIDCGAVWHKSLLECTTYHLQMIATLEFLVDRCASFHSLFQQVIEDAICALLEAWSSSNNNTIDSSRMLESFLCQRTIQSQEGDGENIKIFVVRAMRNIYFGPGWKCTAHALPILSSEYTYLLLNTSV